MKPQVFRNVSLLQYHAIRQRIEAQASDVEYVGNTGTASGHGYTAQWSYDAARETLTIECTGKPLLAPDGYVEDKILALVRSV
jgi:hypothetical protein